MRILPLLMNLLAVIAIGISGWTARELIQVKTDLAALSARVPTSYPPEWFVAQVKDERDANRTAHAAILVQLEMNHKLIIDWMSKHP